MGIVASRPSEAAIISVYRPADKFSGHFLALSPSIVAVYTHFLGRSYLCPGDKCPACQVCIQARWTGLLAVGRPNGEKCLLELSEKAYHTLKRSAGPERIDALAGVILAAAKTGKHDPWVLTAWDGEKKIITPVHEEQVLEDYFVTLQLPGRGANEPSHEHYRGRIEAAARRVIDRVMKEGGAAGGKHQPARTY